MEDVYFEQQALMVQCCGVHTVNNLLQLRPENAAHFRKDEADAIAVGLHEEDAAARGIWIHWVSSWLPCINPYRSSCPCFGNYDISVLAEALHARGYGITAHWAVAQSDRLPYIREDLDRVLPDSGAAA
eukprot:gnl/TRDRNA2_/TRDRNA2_157379_c0_seq2.p1 gnl/TRDRNA2_/TRDRNA2_157379_c0~~gnl/TRDRNA2_/TRDRNA2_157379_c0_seq2.p1  ORF type:complete len:129 (-),score=19.29 gnl/TRDRNA2_/TRDRNA2_157379_c0_seq2:415-801(-)